MVVTYRKKKKSNLPLIAAVAVVVLVAIMLTRTRQPVPEATETVPDKKPVTKETAKIAPPPPAEAAPQVFDDPGQQRIFTAYYDNAYAAFRPAEPGSEIRVIKTDGTRLEGVLLRYTATGLILETAAGMVDVARTDMDEATRRILFAGDFSRALAEEKVAAGGHSGPPGSLEEAFLSPPSVSVIESRRFIADKLSARYGPGAHFAPVPDADLYRGETIQIVAESNGWVCVKHPSVAGYVVGWIPKFSSFTPNPENRAVINREVKELTDAGFIVTINPARNEALVDTYAWKSTDKAALEGKCRLIAYYCAQQKNSRLYWAEIRDATTRRLMAEYSDSKGFRIH